MLQFFFYNFQLCLPGSNIIYIGITVQLTLSHEGLTHTVECYNRWECPKILNEWRASPQITFAWVLLHARALRNKYVTCRTKPKLPTLFGALIYLWYTLFIFVFVLFFFCFCLFFLFNRLFWKFFSDSFFLFLNVMRTI